MNSLTVSPIQTAVFHHGDDVVEFVLKHVDRSLLGERSILAITSKILSVAEGNLIPAGSIDKKTLIEKEADYYLGEIGHNVQLTIKNGLLIPSAGIDESNSEHGDYILYPKDAYKSAEDLRRQICARLGLREFGVIVTDSKSNFLRLGVVGVALAFAGFHPVRNMVGEKDIFGRALKTTKINHVDSLAASAVLMMGEAAERCPLAILKNAPVSFTDSPRRADLEVSPQEDMYLPVYKHLLK
ncbi:coenzyme F420-0:L-glutamate ligase [Bdellovibrio sp. 22V]|uniref:coenzyme F420-0:L-glutamate ligase n=1 Tax=Bdellovibrio sp. 22V TaxID=3044166 RepID=UPI0025435542|nr:coenzyme F420-0:L-glutamate ligase [Bdellovibrio sp. 22V]WII71385.1 coenzyme F420-0:L-glutamate ligase [Bdellovibrio sp. 22V]